MRILIWPLLIALLLTALFLGLSWYISSQFLVPQPYGLQPEFKIIDLSETTVTLPVPPNKNQFANTRAIGTYNLFWETGYAKLGDILEDNGNIVREFSLTSGTMPKAGDDARLETFIFRNDPKTDHGLSLKKSVWLAMLGV